MANKKRRMEKIMPPVPRDIPASVPAALPEAAPAIIEDTADRTRVFTSHGVDLVTYGTSSVGTCPFCGKARKFYVAESSQFQCKVCGEQGNAITFLRTLWERSVTATTAADYAALAEDRKLADPATAAAWGCCRSIIDGLWMVPGYDPHGRLHQLYRRVRTMKDGAYVWTLLPTPCLWPSGRSHGIHMVTSDWDVSRENAIVFEGPWDGMAYWEIARVSKRMSSGALEITGVPEVSLNADTNIYATPGCTTFPDHWLTMFRGKNVTFGFDSDRHISPRDGKMYRAGYDGTRRNAKKLGGVARSVAWIAWGEEGYDPARKDGWDVRDHLTQTPDRRANLGDLVSKIQPVPTAWAAALNGHSHGLVREVEALHCNNWATLEAAWTDAQEWRQVAADVLAVMLAVATSTQQAGNQLFLQVIGSASCGKTTFCDGLLVSNTCHSLEHLSGFHSGWKKPGEDDKDCSLIARINGKTLITPEGDVLMSSPKFAEIMSQCRRIFDGTSGATFKNDDVDRLYTDLRTPWIMAGTQALMDTDQSRLGDRFLRIIFTDPTDEEKRRIARRAFRSEMASMRETASSVAGSILNPKMRRAHALTGGYVDWLRANVDDQLPRIEVPIEFEDMCVALGELTADLRARPNRDPRKHETHDSKEMPYRIASQLGRFGACLAIVKNKTIIDEDIMRIVRKVAIDTAYGHTLNIVKWLAGTSPYTKRPYQERGIEKEILVQWSGMREDKLARYLQFLRSIDVARYEAAHGTHGLWRLTDRVYDLYRTVIMERF